MVSRFLSESLGVIGLRVLPATSITLSPGSCAIVDYNIRLDAVDETNSGTIDTREPSVSCGCKSHAPDACSSLDAARLLYCCYFFISSLFFCVH